LEENEATLKKLRNRLHKVMLLEIAGKAGNAIEISEVRFSLEKLSF
jgi:hypothetical protein